jgi:signal transduction histidine kinase
LSDSGVDAIVAPHRVSSEISGPPTPPSGDEASRALIRLLPGLRAEELIATGRLILGLSLMLAVSRSDELSAATSAAANWLLMAYTAYAVAMLVGIRVAHDRALRYAWIMHAVDVAALSGLLFMTGGTKSEYFSPLFFPIVAAALRWPTLGALRTGAFILLVFIGVGMYSRDSGALDIDSWVVRAAALIATMLLLAQMGRVESRYAAQILRLTRFPRIEASALADLAGQLLQRAAAVLDAARALLVIEDPEEPWSHVFSWRDGGLSHERRAAAHDLDGDGRAIADESPFLLKGRGPDRSALYLSARGPRVRKDVPLPDWLTPYLDAATVVGLPLRGESARGYLFLLDPPDVTADDLRLADVLGRHVSDALERFVLAREILSMTAARERTRVSRDLHDGILQTFSGIALKLATIRRLLGAPDRASDELSELEQLVLDEQRDLRLLAEELSFTPNVALGMAAFPASLGALIQRLEKIWGVTVEWDPTAAAVVPAKAAPEVYQLVREAVVNAARHGAATRIRLRLSESARGLHIAVADNGKGFPFEGSFTLSELIAARRGPRSLRERVHQLAGELFITTSPEGAHIEIVIPSTEVEAWR